MMHTHDIRHMTHDMMVCRPKETDFVVIIAVFEITGMQTGMTLEDCAVGMLLG